MRTLVKVLLGLTVVVVLALGAVFAFTRDMTATADSFFASMAAHEYSSAYGQLSKELRAQSSQADFKHQVHALSLDDVSESHWSSRSIKGSRGTLIGTVKSRRGGVIPLSVLLVKGDDGWKIYSLQKQPSGLKAATQAPMPSKSEQLALVSESAAVFAKSVSEKSTARLYAYMAEAWRKRTSVEELDRIFAGFFHTDLTAATLEHQAPVLTAESSIDKHGLLQVTGYFPTQPERFHFQHRYIREEGVWKLAGMHESIGKPSQ